MNKTLIIGIIILVVLLLGGGTFWFSQSDSVKVEKILKKALTAEEQEIEAPESEEVSESGAEAYGDESSPAESVPTPTQKKLPTPPPVKVSPPTQKKLPTPPPVKVSPAPAPVKSAPSVDKAISAAAQDDVAEAVESDVSEDGAASYQD